MMNPKVSVTVTVTNTGDTYAGKEVVQIYASCPQGRLVKEFRRLAGFGKTKLLAPKESQTMTITFPLYQLTSYEEESASWILEPGMYGIWIGNDLNTSVLSGALELDEKAVMTACENICPLKEELNEIVPDAEKVQAREAAWQKEVKEKRMSVIELKASEIPTEKVDYQPVPEELPGKAGKIVESLSVDQLALLATGDPGRAQGNALGSAGISVPGAAAETSPCASEEPWNVTTIGSGGRTCRSSSEERIPGRQRRDRSERFPGGPGRRILQQTAGKTRNNLLSVLYRNSGRNTSGTELGCRTHQESRRNDRP